MEFPTVYVFKTREFHAKRVKFSRIAAENRCAGTAPLTTPSRLASVLRNQKRHRSLIKVAI